jgi:hypothetical protein
MGGSLSGPFASEFPKRLNATRMTSPLCKTNHRPVIQVFDDTLLKMLKNFFSKRSDFVIILKN